MTRVEVALLWTATAVLMPLPADLTDAALARAVAAGDRDPTAGPLTAP